MACYRDIITGLFFMSTLIISKYEYQTILQVRLILTKTFGQIYYKRAQGRMWNVTETERNIKKAPPVVFSPNGGLGNQMFQYAAAYSLAKKRNSDLYLCLSKNWNTSDCGNCLLTFNSGDRSYLLNMFNIPHNNVIVPNASRCNMTEISKTEVLYPNEEKIIKEDLPIDNTLYLVGHFESEIFFKEHKEEIRQLFTLKPNFNNNDKFYAAINELASEISQTEGVSIHVRKNDFATSDGSRLLPITYYDKAIKLIKAQKFLLNKNVTFFVFSDDIESVKADFRILPEPYNNFVFVSNKNFSRIADFMLMLLCKHGIISNSTFSWWAAYLNKNKDKVVIAPSPRFKKEFYNRNQKFLTQIYGGVWSFPYDWITIDPYKS